MDNCIRPTQTEGADPLEGMDDGFLSAGQVLGDRYRVERLLGTGGMGEVWQAYDLKLQVEVALKALRPDLFRDERRVEGLRREVRAAREVISPNVCRVFDLEEAAGHELLCMEYVDGQTLLEVLSKRGPLEIEEAQGIASQMLAGVGAIHEAGLVHRDIKPENIMVTPSGRVVVMDFGVARERSEGAGTVSGTPAYMAPEQGCGGALDARSDLYAAGVVLTEMVSPDGLDDRGTRKSVWEGVRQDPPRIADTPWAPVLRKAVARRPGERYDSARTLTRALEDVTLRVAGADNLTPYPGLASFTAADAAWFFGREAEAEGLWRALSGPARLLALAGSSTAGKTSFLQAGLIPRAPAGWGVVSYAPGRSPLGGLRSALAPEILTDTATVQALVGSPSDPAVIVAAVAAWRRRHEHALLVVDQLEELFVLAPPEVQASCAELLARLPREADVHVLLALRDGFLGRLGEDESLRGALSDLTCLEPPPADALRRILEEPARRCGHGFEDEHLVDEMVGEVEGERGALALLGLAAADLWARRDRGRGLLTRQAYRDMGGVGGALAHYAGAVVERIGADREPVTREILRNLATADGGRIARAWDELLEVFDSGDRRAAEEALVELVDARLLISYAASGAGGQSARRVEIVHPSLLTASPRLAAWQAEDAGEAGLRDDLRRAARTWDEHGRSKDWLWTGAAHREVEAWRQRYPGGITELEEDFASALAGLARRSRRRRRLAVAGVLLLALVAGLFGTLWHRGRGERRRAEASKLVALGEIQLASSPTAALAWATASLELADTPEARRLALRALRRVPAQPAGEGRQVALEVAAPPPLTLPHDELVATLHALSNARAVRDPRNPTGWRLEPGTVPVRKTTQRR